MSEDFPRFRTSRNTLAIREVIRLLESQNIASLAVTQPGFGETIGMTSTLLINADGPRIVAVTNTSTAGVLFFQRDTDAVLDKGDAVPPGDSRLVPLGEGQILNVIANTGAVKVSGQVYG